MRVTWNIVSKLLELGFDAAIAVDRWREARRARKADKSRGLSFKDVQHQQAQIARATAKTVVIPRRDR